MKLLNAALVLQGLLLHALTISSSGANAPEGGIKPQIVGGTPVSNITEFPYHVGIVHQGSTLTCNGALIDDDWVLTTASCARRPYTLSVLLASTTHGRQAPQPSYSPQSMYMDIGTADIIVHPQYSRSNLKNDIALIKLPYTVSLKSPYIKTIKFNKDTKKLFEGSMSIITGMGNTNAAVGQSDLMMINMKVMTQDACIDASLYNLDNSHLCAETTGPVGPCKYDNGAPLVILGNDKAKTPLLVGMYAEYYTESMNCDSTDTTRLLFTRVASVSQWIAKTMASRK